MALILDTGVVIASLDRRDRHHERCRSLIGDAQERLVLPSPVLPEVDYWVTEALGAGAMVAFVRDIRAGAFVVEDLLPADYARVEALLDRYADLGPGFVDTAILTICERLGEPKLATLDHRHFSVMRPRHVDALELVP
ncbi:MAG: type II toxin-antitoxin system VapC family toxin [Actinomycetota bacterium]